MRIFRTLAVIVGLALLLSACGALSGLIPAQQINNPLGINNESVTLTQGSTAGLAPQATSTTTFSGTFSGTFPDINTSSLPGGITPKGFEADVDLGATATLSSASSTSSSAFPTSFDVTAATLSLTVKDGSGSPTFTLPTINASGTLLTATEQSCSGSAPVTCTYALKAGPDLGAALFPIKLSQSQVATLFKIVTQGSKTNDANGSFSLTLNQSLPSDATLKVTLVSPKGTLSF